MRTVILVMCIALSVASSVMAVDSRRKLRKIETNYRQSVSIYEDAIVERKKLIDRAVTAGEKALEVSEQWRQMYAQCESALAKRALP